MGVATPNRLKMRWRLGSALCALGLLTGCGGTGSNTASTPAPAPAPTPTPTPAPTPAPTPTPTPTATFITSEYNRSDGPSFHNAIPAWQTGKTGLGVTIGIIDTGIDSSSPEFAGRISAASADVAGSRGINPEDDHGTNVAMVAAAARDNTGIVGIAWQATILALRADTPGSCATYDPNVKGSGCDFTDNNIALGIDRAVQNGAKVINLSLGGSSPNATLRAAVARATTAGIVIVVSAGNDGASTDPAIDPNNPDPFGVGLRAVGNGNVIIAGSVNDVGVFSSFSNRAGTEASWFLSALGERVCCVYENGVLKVITNPDGSKSAFVFSGTSFSAPQIAGAAALLRQAYPNLTAAQVVDLLLRSARDAGVAGIDSTYGRGILDIGNAFAAQGTLSLANTLVALPTGDTTGVVSAAMGDAVQQQPLGAVELDSYGRAYQVSLGASLRGAQVSPKLASALIAPMRNVSGGNGQLSLAFSVDGRSRSMALPWSGQLRLSRADADTARVMAARMVAQLSPKTRFAFAYAQGGDGLVAQLQGRSDPAFLVAGSPLDDVGFSRSGQMALALRQQLGQGWGLTLSAERAQAISGAPIQYAAERDARRQQDGVSRLGVALDRRFGELDAMLGASWLSEDRTILGARLHDAFGSRGADSLFLDAHLGWQPAQNWQLGADWRQGFTHARLAGLVDAGSRLSSNGWAVNLVRADLFKPGDTLALRLSQPLRVQSGGFNLLLPIDYSYDTLSATQAVRRLSLSPSGREITSELAWRGPLWNGSASASLFYRRQPGHYASLPDDQGVAVSWTQGF